MELDIEGYQFLSRLSIPDQDLGLRRISPRQRPEIALSLRASVQVRPFEMNFVQLVPSRPSIGAFEYFDDEVDYFMSRRWPKCLALHGTVTLPGQDLTEQDAANLLVFVRTVLWHSHSDDAATQQLYSTDQLATGLGYRREYFDRQIFDIAGHRRPNSKEAYVQSSVAEPIGPGVASFPRVDAFRCLNEFAWSQILPFPCPQGLPGDLDEIRRRVSALKKHYNSYAELRDTARHISLGQIKAAVTAAAAAAEAILRFYCTQWGVAFPDAGRLPFDDKVEKILADAGKPSYRAVEPAGLATLLFLYRARSKRHEGDCYYNDGAGNRVDVRSIDQVKRFAEAVESFVLWIDSLT